MQVMDNAFTNPNVLLILPFGACSAVKELKLDPTNDELMVPDTIPRMAHSQVGARANMIKLAVPNRLPKATGQLGLIYAYQE